MSKRNRDDTEIGSSPKKCKVEMEAAEGEDKKEQEVVQKINPFVYGEPLTEYEIQFAKEQGADQDDIEDMQMTFHMQKKQDEDEERYSEDPENHGDACDCDQCRMMLFDGEMDENNDGGALVIAEWKERVAKAKVEKALRRLRERESNITSFLKRKRDYEAQRAKKTAEFEAAKNAYVHVEGTSKLLEYGMVPSGLKYKLLKFPFIKEVDTVMLDNKQIRCRITVIWPRPELNPAQREAHVRIFLEQEGIKLSTSKDLLIVGKQ